jgi:hypothetical protein
VNIFTLSLPSYYFFVPVLVYFDPKHAIASIVCLALASRDIFDPFKFIFGPLFCLDLGNVRAVLTGLHRTGNTVAGIQNPK